MEPSVAIPNIAIFLGKSDLEADVSALELDSLIYRNAMTFLRAIYIAAISLYTMGINFSF